MRKSGWEDVLKIEIQRQIWKLFYKKLVLRLFTPILFYSAFYILGEMGFP